MSYKKVNTFQLEKLKYLKNKLSIYGVEDALLSIVESTMLSEAQVQFKDPSDFAKFIRRAKEEKLGAGIIRRLPAFRVVLGKSADGALEKIKKLLQNEFNSNMYTYYDDGIEFKNGLAQIIKESVLFEATDDRRLNRYLGIDETDPAWQDFMNGRELALKLWEIDTTDQSKFKEQKGLSLLSYTMGRDPNQLYMDAYEFLYKMYRDKEKGIWNPLTKTRNFSH